MWPHPPDSYRSADLTPGTVVGGFRVDRVIGRGSRAVVYEATQLSLDRRVALKVMHDRELAGRVRTLHWPDHPGAVSLFDVGDSEHGPWLAMRLVSGGTLETRRARLDPVVDALASAHAAGIVHGEVTARNVLVDGAGHAYLSDFGLARGEATADDDRAALAELVRDRGPSRLRSRGALLAGAGLVLAGAALGAVLISGDGGDSHASAGPPPAPAGTRSIGSNLAAGDVESVDCEGRPTSGGSLACTVSQRDLGGRPVVAPADGTIRSWAVRGARGPLVLQVLRGRGNRFVEVDRSDEEMVLGPEPHVVRSDLAVAAGDRLALEVTPTTLIGIRRSDRRASIDRWFGPLVDPARRPERPAGTGLDHELLLRVDIGPRSRTALAPLRGDRAAAARPGRRLDVGTIAVGGGEVRTVECALLAAGLAVDLYDGARRIGRTPVAGADGRGELVAFTPRRGSVRVRWRNPDGRTIDRRYTVTRDALR